MRTHIITPLLIILFLVSGCVGIGVVKTSDPAQKLDDARYLFEEQDRPLLAEGLIIEATNIYLVEKNYHWLGHSYRAYGDFLRSQAVTNHAAVYEKFGFDDESITLNNRFEISKEKFNQAIEYYKKAEEKLVLEKSYDALTNLYFSLAWTYYQVEGKNDVICGYFEKTDQAYLNNIQQNPNVKQFGSVEDQIKKSKKQFGCGAAL